MALIDPGAGGIVPPPTPQYGQIAPRTQYPGQGPNPIQSFVDSFFKSAGSAIKSASDVILDPNAREKFVNQDRGPGGFNESLALQGANLAYEMTNIPMVQRLKGVEEGTYKYSDPEQYEQEKFLPPILLGGAALGMAGRGAGKAGKALNLGRDQLDIIAKTAGLSEIGFPNTIEGAAQAIEAGVLKGLPRDLRAAIMAVAKGERAAAQGTSGGALENTLQASIDAALATKKGAAKTGDTVRPTAITPQQFSDFLEGKPAPKKPINVPRTFEQIAAEAGDVTPAQKKQNSILQEAIRKKALAGDQEATAELAGGAAPRLLDDVPSPGFTPGEIADVPLGRNAFQETTGLTNVPGVGPGTIGKFADDAPLPGQLDLFGPNAADDMLRPGLGGGGDDLLPPPGNRGFWDRFGDNFRKPSFNEILDVAGSTKTAVSSGDISATTRQALPFLLAHPIASGKAFVNQIKSIKNGTQFFDDMILSQKIRSQDNGLTDLYLRERGGGVVHGEESFATHLFERMAEREGKMQPFWKAVREFTGRSERGFNAMLNTVVSEVGNGLVESNRAMANTAREAGDANWQKLLMSAEQRKDLAWTLNHAAGRGFDLKNLDPNDARIAMAKVANIFMFSPQYKASRFVFLKDVAQGHAEVLRDVALVAAGKKRRVDPVALEKVRLGYGYVAGVAGTLELLHEAFQTDESGWLDIDFNPLSENFGVRMNPTHSDLGKVNIGQAGGNMGLVAGGLGTLGLGVQTNERDRAVMVDLMAGEAQVVRTMARILSTIKDIPSGDEFNPDATYHSGRVVDYNNPGALDRDLKEDVQGFFENSAAPFPRFLLEAAEDPQSLAEASFRNPILSLVIPLTFQDAIEGAGWKEESLPEGKWIE